MNTACLTDSSSTFALVGAVTTSFLLGVGVVCLLVGALAFAGSVVDRLAHLKGLHRVAFNFARYAYGLLVGGLVASVLFHALLGPMRVSPWEFALLVAGGLVALCLLHRAGLLLGTKRYRYGGASSASA